MAGRSAPISPAEGDSRVYGHAGAAPAKMHGGGRGLLSLIILCRFGQRRVGGAADRHRVDRLHAPARQGPKRLHVLLALRPLPVVIGPGSRIGLDGDARRFDEGVLQPAVAALALLRLLQARRAEIGRASCRERV